MDYNFAITRTFNSSPKDVWQAWTKKELLDRWSSPKGFTVVESNGTLKVGGKYTLTMKSDFFSGVIVGKYLTIDEPHLLEMTHQWDNEDGTFTVETVISVSLKGEQGNTVMSFRQSGFENKERADSHKDGWSECFDKLEAFLSK